MRLSLRRAWFWMTWLGLISALGGVSALAAPSDVQLEEMAAHRAFLFFWNESNPVTGLTKDRARNLGRPDANTVASVAATGYALASLPIAAQRYWITQDAAYRRALRTLRFVAQRLPQDHGFFYHFVDWRTGTRVWQCELSSIDSALLVLGALADGQYWPRTEVALLAEALYERMDFGWMLTDGGDLPQSLTLSMGWKPETGWLGTRWAGYSEASFLYLLALGSPTHPIAPRCWATWDTPLTRVEGHPVFGGPTPLFMAQMASGYFDLGGMRDGQGRDWWANFRNAHLANHAYCARNPQHRKTYSGAIWGITACDQPPPVGYGAQVPADGRNDGTVAPTAAVGAIVFAPELARASLHALYPEYRGRIWGRYGFSNAFNADKNWYDRDVIGIDLGMMLLALENARSGLVWRLMRRVPGVKRGLAAAGFHRAQA
ncbi:MAG: hypothetical protein JO250_13855 [Armatimonadetes bacterium]|nr:hypothetical protein [Armatimonadota bacterium]